MSPHAASSWADGVAGALTAYACGDALGVPWEGRAPGAEVEEIEQLPAREGWPRGATSDDTALTLLVARHLVEQTGDPGDPGDPGDAEPRRLLALIVDAARGAADPRGGVAADGEPVRGLGPSTRAAIERYVATGELPATGGRTNGAAMRALPIGWAVPTDQPDRRRALAIALSRATHPDPDAQLAACIVAACGAWALEGSHARLLVENARDDERALAPTLHAGRQLAEMLGAVAGGRWAPPEGGVGLDPYETVAAVLDCVLRATSLRDGLLRAVRLGGDTDTTAALTGGLLGSQLTPEQVLDQLPWHDRVALPDPATVTELAAGLATRRSHP